jgi:hypothetical protein
MIASKVSAEVLLSAAREVGVSLDIRSLSAMRHRVKVNPDRGSNPDAFTPKGNRRAGEAGDLRYQRTSANATRDTSRVNAVCWHGFRDFFRAVYRRNPDAVFTTAMAKWAGSEHFEANFPASGMRNVGSAYMPMMAAEVCRCPESGWAR